MNLFLLFLSFFLCLSFSFSPFPLSLSQFSGPNYSSGVSAGQPGGAALHDSPVPLCYRGNAGAHGWHHPGRGLRAHHLRGKVSPSTPTPTPNLQQQLPLFYFRIRHPAVAQALNVCFVLCCGPASCLQTKVLFTREKVHPMPALFAEHYYLSLSPTCLCSHSGGAWVYTKPLRRWPIINPAGLFIALIAAGRSSLFTQSS